MCGIQQHISHQKTHFYCRIYGYKIFVIQCSIKQTKTDVIQYRSLEVMDILKLLPHPSIFMKNRPSDSAIFFSLTVSGRMHISSIFAV